MAEINSALQMKITVVNLGDVRFSKKVQTTIAANSKAGHQDNRAGVRFVDIGRLATRPGVMRPSWQCVVIAAYSADVASPA